MSPADVLAALADCETLLCLHGGTQGWTHVALAVSEEPFTDWRRFALRPQRTDSATPGAPSAWRAFPGGWFVQADYEFPRTPGRAWRVHAWASWAPNGTLTLHGADALPPAGTVPLPARLATPLTPAWPAAEHAARVAAIRAFIAAGDIYQANLTLPFTATLAPGAQRDLALFLTAAARSPAAYAGFFRAPGRASVISHSPECFLRLAGGALASEPIKGTRRRDGDDAARRTELLTSAKERAELAMIVDLMRNDLGRTAAPGSVRVPLPAAVIDLPYVHHLVALVTARLADGATVGEAIAAAFPAGSITGAPKRRAMEIIAALEARPRGAYCGAFGWIGDDGDAQLAVAIRTATVAGDALAIHAGSGIVADADAAAEWDEVLAKASGLGRLLEPA